MNKLTLLTAVFICCLRSSYSQPGQLDSSFGNNGIVSTDFGISTRSGWAYGQQVFTQNDGSIYLVVGAGESGALITRFHANGTRDSSYGYNGYSKFVSFNVGDGALQSDGKIVVAGTSSEDFALARYNTDGSFDTAFSGDGKLTTDFASGNDRVSSVAIQSDGKIVAAGISSGDLALARYNTDGTLDAAFSEDGKQTTDFEPAVYSASAAIQGDGKIVAAFRNSFDAGWNLARYNTDGSLDNTFSGDGIETTDFGGQSAISSIAIQNDGKIVAVGTAYAENGNFFALARYNTDGSLDAAFSEDGKQTTIFDSYYSNSFGGSVTIQPDGKIVATGPTADQDNNFTIFGVARYNTDGTPDNSFSEDGRQTTDLGGGQGQYPSSIVVQSNGRILVAGTVFNDIPDFALARYNTNGTLDATFSGDGKLRDYIHVSNTYYTSTAIQNDGKIVAAGSGLARYNTDGTLDNTFSDDGKQTSEFGISSAALQKDGKIVVVGTFDDGFGNFSSSVARYNIDGTPDNTFNVYFQEYTLFRSVAIQGDGKIIVGGGGVDFLVIRLNADGTPDSTFSEDGKQMTDFGDYEYVQSVAIQNDGKIVVAGASSGNFALARYNANGSVDQTFSEDGKETTDFGSNNDVVRDVAIQRDGKIVVIGNAGDTSYFALARYNTQGTLDTTFSEDGKQTALTGTANAVDIQSDGKILVGGTNGYFALVRFNTNGSIDNSFGTNGTQVTTASEGTINDIAIVGDKLYAAGAHQNPGNIGAVARYLLDSATENKPPTITLSIPYNIVKYTAPARIKLNATATDEDGKITKVQFFNGTTRLHTEDVYPYGFLWTDVPAGIYTLTAKAFDNSGNVTTSNSIEVSVADENVPPVVSIVSPVDDTTYTGPATIQIITKANDPNDRIAKVEFYSGTALIRTEYIYPYRYRWSNVQPGNYTITAKAYDDKGLSTTSEPVTVTVSNASIVSSRPSSVKQTDVTNALSLRVSPNPARSTLQIFTKGLQLNKPSTISVINASGVVLKTIQSNVTNQVVQLDVSSLVRGVYTLKLVSGQKVIYKRFVKL